MFLDSRQIELIKKAIEDFKFIGEEIENKIKKGYSLEDIEMFLNRFKDIEITCLDSINGDGWLDFLYKDINTCVSWTKEDGVRMCSTFEIYDRKTNAYIVEDYCNIEEYEKLINTPKEVMLKNAVADLKYYESNNYLENYNKQRDRIIEFLKKEY